ncbi:MAG: MFS transporter [Nocardioides sp.]
MGEIQVHKNATRLWTIYLAIFFGPFVGTMVAPLLPELSDHFNTDMRSASLAITSFWAPCALLLLISGRLAQRWGLMRTLRCAYLVYAVALVMSAAAPSLPVLLISRVFQGMANAFTALTLLALLKESTSESRRPRALTVFASMQTAGLAFAPVIGGLFATYQWRFMFAFIAVIFIFLSILRYPGAMPQVFAEHRESGTARSVVNFHLVLPCLVAMLMYLTVVGTTILGALVAGERFGYSPLIRGALLATLGVAALMSVVPLGRWAGNADVNRFGAVGLISGGTAICVVGTASTTGLLVSGLCLAGAGCVASRVAVNRLVALVAPMGFAVAASMTLSFQFLGGALAPLVVTATYGGPRPGPAMLISVAAALGAVALLIHGLLSCLGRPEIGMARPSEAG